MILLTRGTACADLSTPQRPQGLGKVVNQGLTCTDATVETMQSVPDVLVSLAEGPPRRADLARHRAITLQAGSHPGGPGTRSGPLLASAAGQAARNGLFRPPGPPTTGSAARRATAICTRASTPSPRPHPGYAARCWPLAPPAIRT